METFIKITQFLLSLSLLIVLHELGHYIPAKLFKTRVEKFYLFFDYKFSLFKKKIGDTVYGIGWIPLGGYVKISGMIDESMDKEQMAKPPQPWEFRSKPAWQRLIIMLGGVTVNFLLGIFIYMMMFNVWGVDYVGVNDVKNGFSVTDNFKDLGFQDGDKILKVNGEEPFNVLDINKHLFLRDVNSIEVKRYDGQIEKIDLPDNIGLAMWQAGTMEPFTPRFSAVLDSILPNTLASKAGLLKGDIVTAIDSQPITFWNELTNLIKKNTDASEMLITVNRDGFEKTIAITPENNQVGISTRGLTSNDITINHKEFTFGESIGKGLV